MRKNIELYNKLSYFHIVLWLTKDTFWALDLKWLSLFMIIPTLGVAVLITYKLKNIRIDLFHNLAICFWIAGNSIWMIYDFYFPTKSRTIAITFFIIGLIIALYFYLNLALSKYDRK